MRAPVVRRVWLGFPYGMMSAWRSGISVGTIEASHVGSM